MGRKKVRGLRRANNTLATPNGQGQGNRSANLASETPRASSQNNAVIALPISSEIALNTPSRAAPHLKSWKHRTRGRLTIRLSAHPIEISWETGSDRFSAAERGECFLENAQGVPNHRHSSDLDPVFANRQAAMTCAADFGSRRRCGNLHHGGASFCRSTLMRLWQNKAVRSP